MKELFEELSKAFAPFNPQLTLKAPVKVDISALTFKPVNDLDTDAMDEGEQSLSLELNALYGEYFIFIDAEICMQYEYRKGSGKLSDPPSERYAIFTPISYDLKVTTSSDGDDYDIDIDEAYKIVREYIKKRICI